ncbi:hypothetical protein HBB16_10720 [Pseudonocardia sp. MCCB 268]|nr:hypothetical protein [Pseudonocardia cytotoxica]
MPAPDVGTDEQVMAWMMDTCSVNAGYSAARRRHWKLLARGSAGRAGATSRVSRSRPSPRSRRREGPGCDECRGAGFEGRGVAALYMQEAGKGRRRLRRVHGGCHREAGLTRQLQEYLRDQAGSVADYPDADRIRTRTRSVSTWTSWFRHARWRTPSRGQRRSCAGQVRQSRR